VVANLQCSGGELDACAASIAQAERIVRLHYGETHPEFADVLRVRSLLGVFGQARADEGIALVRRAQALLTASYPERHETVSRIRTMLARRLIFSHDAAAGTTALDEAIALMESVHAAHAEGHLPLQPLHRITLAQALARRDGDGDRARARALLEQNEHALRAYPPAYSMTFYNRYLLARVAYQEGDAARADALLAGMVAPLRLHLDSTNNRLVLRDVLMLRARVALDGGDTMAADDLLAQAVTHMQSTFGPDHVGTVRTRNALRALRDTGDFALLN
jgi:hypothetical protein